LALELAIPAVRPVLYVEREAFAAALVVEAIEAGYLAEAPLWANLRTLRGRRFRGCLDLIFGGIPCQPHSEAGPALGAADERDLWPPTRRLLVQSGAWAIFIENVGGMLHTGGAHRIHRGLRRLGFAVAGGLFTAAEVGGSHERERLFILGVNDALADPDRAGSPQRLRFGRDPRPQPAAPERGGRAMGDSDRGRRGGRPIVALREPEQRAFDPWTGPGPAFPPGPDDDGGWARTLAVWPHLEPVVCGKPYELATRLDRARQWATAARANRLDRLRLLGGGVVPLEAAFAFRTLAVDLARTSSGAARLVRMMAQARHIPAMTAD
jgi:DNA (cytosine-5)-methyltransferase 1